MARLPRYATMCMSAAYRNGKNTVSFSTPQMYEAERDYLFEKNESMFQFYIKIGYLVKGELS